MRNVKINTKKIVATLLTSSMVLSTAACSGKKDIAYIDKTYQDLQQDEDLKTENDYVEETTEYVVLESTTSLEELENKSEPSFEENIEYECTEPSTELIKNESKNEDDVVMFFENISNSVDETILSDKFEDVKESVTSAFAKFVLFMSDDLPIGGYTFSSLTDEGKQKIEILFIKMDNKLESKFPGYKEIICEKSEDIKTFVKEKYNLIKLNVENYIISKVGKEMYEDTLNDFRSGFVDMKDSFSYTFDIFGDKLEDAKNNIVDWSKEKVKEKK